MKKYVYVLLDSEKNIVAIYEAEDLAKSLLVELSKKLGKELTLNKIQVNKDISLIS